MTRERNADAHDLRPLLAAALQSQARDMFPDDTPVPPIAGSAGHRSTGRSAWPLVAVAAGVTAVVVAAGVLVPGAGPLVPAAGGIELGPPCELGWDQSVSRVQFSVDGAGAVTWRVWEQDSPDRRFCLSVAPSGGGSTETSVARDLDVLQGAALVSMGGRVYLWGVVTPAATRVDAMDASGTWSAAWTQPDLHILPSALGVFVTPIDRADRPITVRVSNAAGAPAVESVVTGS